MTIRENVRLHAHHVPKGAFCGKPAIIDAGTHAFNDNPIPSFFRQHSEVGHPRTENVAAAIMSARG